LGEVVRRLEDVRQDLREDMRELAKRLDAKVNQETYDLRHTALLERVAALESKSERDAERVAATRRWLIGAVLVPLLGIILPIAVLLLRGAGS
jgi:hypothetical protein